jgi:hypothetical protein
LAIVQEKINLFLEGKLKDHKFDLFALKFLRVGIESIALNFDAGFLADNIHKFLEKFLSFIIFNVRNRSSKSRDSAKGMLALIAVLYHQLDPNEVPALQNSKIVLEGFGKTIDYKADSKPITEDSFMISCLIAGLAGDSVYMKSCTIEALAYIVKTLGQKCTSELLSSCTEVVLLLIKEKNRETLASIFKFLKAIFKKQSKSVLADQLALIAEGMFEWDPQNARAIRNKAKTLISVIIRKFV